MGGCRADKTATSTALASHPYSRSHTRREKRKVKQNLAGGNLDAVADALKEAFGTPSEDEGEVVEPVGKRSKAGKAATAEDKALAKPKRRGPDGEELIGEGKGRTMREKARRKQM
jgi:hypothetical protein